MPRRGSAAGQRRDALVHASPLSPLLGPLSQTPLPPPTSTSPGHRPSSVPCTTVQGGCRVRARSPSGGEDIEDMATQPLPRGVPL